MCYNDSCMVYSTTKLVIGECYDVYFAQYAFSDEYEIFKDDIYITSFHVTYRDDITRELDEIFLKYFYNKEQMRTHKINTLIS